MSRKIERLINLTIALLATKRYLTKSDIFRTVVGYEGSEESKERMFERDKDDLRNLGVSIDVGGIDPAFEDEAGYRIRPEGYALDLGDISGTEVALLSLAAEAWGGAALDGAAHSALTKLASMGIESDLDGLPAIAPRLQTPYGDFHSITSAISKRQSISFTYISPTLERQQRTVEPYALATKESHWYLAGNDAEKNQVRTFRLDRIDGEITLNRGSSGFEIPVDFDLFASLEHVEKSNVAILHVRKGKAHLLRNRSTSTIDKGEWDEITVNYAQAQLFIDLVLWHGQDALIIEPEFLRDQIIESLKAIVDLHG